MNDADKLKQQLEELRQNLADYTARLNKVVAAGVAPAIQEQANTAVAALQSAVNHTEKMLKASKPEEALEAQASLISDISDRFQASAQNLMKLQEKTGKDLAALLDEGSKAFSAEYLESVVKKKKT